EARAGGGARRPGDGPRPGGGARRRGGGRRRRGPKDPGGGEAGPAAGFNPPAGPREPAGPDHHRQQQRDARGGRLQEAGGDGQGRRGYRARRLSKRRDRRSPRWVGVNQKSTERVRKPETAGAAELAGEASGEERGGHAVSGMRKRAATALAMSRL